MRRVYGAEAPSESNGSEKKENEAQKAHPERI